ncbi:MAG: VCBS repeat-containing protein [Planctomycetes bacterium]|nr:VCBS repeat-containing protein [Planctomycetota bacterium]
MKRLPLVVLAVCLTANLPFAAAQPNRQRGSAEANVTRPKSFPHRIWAACDFEAQTPDYAWFGPAQTGDVPKYAANKTALGVAARPYKKFVGKPNDGKKYDLLIDDVIFFANDPKLPPEPEPFPNRVIFLAAFDTGTNPKARKKYWPGAFDIITKEAPEDSYWGVARAVARKDRKGKWIRLQISPTRQVGAHTKLRFRYHLTGASRMTVQIFDLTDKDNRHIVLRGCKQNQWTTRYLDFTKDAKRNDGGKTPFAAGHVVDDIFFYVKPDGDLDMFSCEMAIGGEGRWFIWENPGAKRAGTKWTQHIILSGVYGHESRVGDVDGDGDIDICSKPWNGDRHVYLENLLIRKAR